VHISYETYIEEINTKLNEVSDHLMLFVAEWLALGNLSHFRPG